MSIKKQTKDFLESLTKEMQSGFDNDLGLKTAEKFFILCKVKIQKDDLDVLNSFFKENDEKKLSSHFYRAYLEYLNGNKKKALLYLEMWGTALIEEYQPSQLLLYISTDISIYDDDFIQEILRRFRNKLPLDDDLKMAFKALEISEKKPDKAISVFQNLVSKYPDFWAANLFIAYIYEQINSPMNAIKNFEKLLKFKEVITKEELEIEIYSSLNNLYYKIGDIKKALHYGLEGLKANPDFQIYNNIGYFYFYLGEYKKAEKYLRKSISLGQNVEIAHWNLLRLYKKLKDYPKALKILKKLEKLSRKKAYIKKEINRLKEKVNSDDYSDIIEIPNTSKQSTKKIDFKDPVATGSLPEERILEDLLLKMIQRNELVFEKRLKIYEDEDCAGQQLIMPDVGRLDLLTVDENNDLLVIELKKDDAYNDAVVQTKSYIKWIKENLATKNQKVKGLICLHSASEQLLNDAKKANIEVQEYSFSFNRKV